MYTYIAIFTIIVCIARPVTLDMRPLGPLPIWMFRGPNDTTTTNNNYYYYYYYYKYIYIYITIIYSPTTTITTIYVTMI